MTYFHDTISSCFHRKTIIEDVIKTQLAEYEVLFAGGESDAWLTKVDLRRKWLLKTAVEFEKTLAAMFPPSWQVCSVRFTAFETKLRVSFCTVWSICDSLFFFSLSLLTIIVLCLYIYGLKVGSIHSILHFHVYLLT